MTIGEFSGSTFPLAVGEVFGIRTWKVDRYGRLRAIGCGSAGPWRPGVNVAKCHAGSGSVYINGYGSGGLISAPLSYSPASFTFEVESPPTYEYRLNADGSATVAMTQPSAPRPIDPPKVSLRKKYHRAPSDECRCGFYAYSNAKSDELTGEVTGVIAGFGRTLLGTRGFRCEKARIVALLDPTRGGAKTGVGKVWLRDSIARIYPDVPLMSSKAALLQYAPLTETLPAPDSEDFWALP